MTIPATVSAWLRDKPARWLASAPGRVNLIGEHVDYCDGFVLPAAIGLRTWMSGEPRSDNMLVVETAEGLRAEMEANAVPGAGLAKWENYLRGVLAGVLETGISVPAMTVRIASTLPQGGGLASSAALTVAFATLLEAAAGRRLNADDKARICQDAESRFAGVPSGCMDQLASVHGRAGHAMLIDCRSRAVEMVPLTGVSLLIVNSGVRHDLADGAYATRRAETEEAASILGVPALRDADEVLLMERAGNLTPGLFMRARHVIGECGRTLECAAAMKSGDWSRAGALMNQSHASLRDDFEVSCAELDLIAAYAQAIPGIYGCRMTGGGFGGCCVALVRTEAAEEVAGVLEAFCRQNPGEGAGVILTESADGAGTAH